MNQVNGIPEYETSDTVLIQKRDGRTVPFEPVRIASAIEAAFRAEQGLGRDSFLGEDTTHVIHKITHGVMNEVDFEASRKNPVDVERVQDLVETELMEAGEFRVAKRYIVYRENRSRARAVRGQLEGENAAQKLAGLKFEKNDGSVEPLEVHFIKRRLYEACHGLEMCSASELMDDLATTLFDGIREPELERAMVMVARQRIERDPAYNQVATRLMLNILYREALGVVTDFDHMEPLPLFDGSKTEQQSRFEGNYRNGFKQALEVGVEHKRMAAELLDFDLDVISSAIDPQRDFDFQYLGVQTLYDRYLIHVEDEKRVSRRIETPQFFWMRVAMGLSLKEEHREIRAIEFYNMLSTFRFVSATPTLFNSGSCHPQLSSCYLTTIDDDLHHIYKCMQDNAMLSKWAGGLGNDWTRVRATGAHIKGTNGKSQGIIPFMKVANDTAIAVNQGGKRKGAICGYLESWHLDIEEFLDLRKNTGDDRRRTHDMHTANWIPDLFMKRVGQNAKWTLFSPDEVPELHDLYGREFETKYLEYEARAENGELRQFKRIEAVDLWRKMLSMVFETGHPWLTFKDPSNLRSPQDHAGVVHNSNLCTEILLNTSNDETAVCNLGSVNLRVHVKQEGIDREMVAETVKTAIRMLDNVIDINYYPTEEAKNANLRHRPIGMGIMGFQDALFIQRIPYASEGAIRFADESMELISYHAIISSSKLAAERGTYQSYEGSKWDRGLLPVDTIQLVKDARDGDLDMDQSQSMDWTAVRESVAAHGMRNSNTMAIAPTATISNIAGSYQSIEPNYRNLFVKSNLSGDFTIINEYLVKDLKRMDIWDDRMLDDLKYYDGELAEIERIPEELKRLYQTAFEVDPYFLVEANSRRQKWVDMGISFNLYLAKPSGRMLSDMYSTCWRKGLKTTYYLRSMAATQIEKSSMDVNKRGAQPRWMKSKSASSAVIDGGVAEGIVDAGGEIQNEARMATEVVVGEIKPPQGDDGAPDLSQSTYGGPQACSIDNPDCEACQ